MNDPTGQDNTVAIIQARMGSTRLPGKVLKDICGRPMLWHVYERASCASLVDRIVIATSTESRDDAIAAFCEEQNIPFYRGSESDVLKRYYQAACMEDADSVVRLTGDCPLLSPSIICRMIRVYERSTASYVTNILDQTHPDGLDVEVFSISTLKASLDEATKPEEREHVTIYIRESGNYEIENVSNVLDTSQYSFADKDTMLRWSVDYPEDLEFVREIYKRLTRHRHWVFDQQAVYELLEREPELCEINEHR